jgi:ribulose-5-phosphate 4-epimerase/fuculose-1-phosphate aldolase
MTTREELAGKLIKAWRYFFDRGFVDGFGHISCRAPEAGYFLVSRHSLGGHAAPEDFVLVDLDGRQVDASAMLPGELPIYLEIYRRRPDVGSVAHFHTMFATSFFCFGSPAAADIFSGSDFPSRHSDPS